MKTSTVSTTIHRIHSSIARRTVRSMAAIDSTFVTASHSGRWPPARCRIHQSAATAAQQRAAVARRCAAVRRERTTPSAVSAARWRLQDRRPGIISAK
jgi:hypothetical protein